MLYAGQRRQEREFSELVYRTFNIERKRECGTTLYGLYCNVNNVLRMVIQRYLVPVCNICRNVVTSRGNIPKIRGTMTTEWRVFRARKRYLEYIVKLKSSLSGRWISYVCLLLHVSIYKCKHEHIQLRDLTAVDHISLAGSVYDISVPGRPFHLLAGLACMVCMVYTCFAWWRMHALHGLHALYTAVVEVLDDLVGSMK